VDRGPTMTEPERAALEASAENPRGAVEQIR
jgi:hypothetical protein